MFELLNYLKNNEIIGIVFSNWTATLNFKTNRNERSNKYLLYYLLFQEYCLSKRKIQKWDNGWISINKFIKYV